MEKQKSARDELVEEIRNLAQSQGLNTVFTTFLEISAASIAAQTDPVNAGERERRYEEMASQMEPEVLNAYARMLALLWLAICRQMDDPCDILGDIYHELQLNHEWNGQFFTPDHICRRMEKIVVVVKEGLVSNVYGPDPHKFDVEVIDLDLDWAEPSVVAAEEARLKVVEQCLCKIY